MEKNSHQFLVTMRDWDEKAALKFLFGAKRRAQMAEPDSEMSYGYLSDAHIAMVRLGDQDPEFLIDHDEERLHIETSRLALLKLATTSWTKDRGIAMNAERMRRVALQADDLLLKAALHQIRAYEGFEETGIERYFSRLADPMRSRGSELVEDMINHKQVSLTARKKRAPELLEHLLESNASRRVRVRLDDGTVIEAEVNDQGEMKVMGQTLQLVAQTPGTRGYDDLGWNARLVQLKVLKSREQD